MSTLADYRTVAPACYVVQDRSSGLYLANPLYHTHRHYGTDVASEAWEFATEDDARWARGQYNLDPRRTAIRTRQPKVELTDEGRAQVLARRAERRAERGL